MFGGRAGRQRESRPPPPPPALTSHPEASGKGKSMGSLRAGARGPGLESDPCRVFTDLKADRFKWAHLYLERKLGSPDPDKATFYSMKIYRHQPHSPTTSHSTIHTISHETSTLGTPLLKFSSERATNGELRSYRKPKTLLQNILLLPLLQIFILFSPPAVCKYWLSSRAAVEGLTSELAWGEILKMVQSCPHEEHIRSQGWLWAGLVPCPSWYLFYQVRDYFCHHC